MPEPLRVVHYVNQFFGGIGGEAAFADGAPGVPACSDRATVAAQASWAVAARVASSSAADVAPGSR